eukprot:COSAG05_NODE_45_length_25418_cov_92.923299_27_plen_330_part_00
MPPKGSGKPKGKRKSAGNSARVQAEAAAALAAAGGCEAASDAGLIAAHHARGAGAAAAGGGGSGGDAPAAGEAPPAIAGGYYLGARVEYRSATLGGWARAEVTAINAADGTVSVQTLGCGVRADWANTRSKDGLVPNGPDLRIAGSVAGAKLVQGYESAEDRRKRMQRQRSSAFTRRTGQPLAIGNVASDAGDAVSPRPNPGFDRSVPSQDRMLRRDANDLVARVQAGHPTRSPQQQEQAMALAAERNGALFAPATEAAIARDPHHIVGKLFGATMAELKERKTAASTGNASRPGNAATTDGVAPQNAAAARQIRQTLMAGVRPLAPAL